jgi:TonB family protein
MAGSVRLLLLWLAGCAAPKPVSTQPPDKALSSGDAPEVVSFRSQSPEFYDRARKRLGEEFHAKEIADKAQLGSGRWRVVVRIDLDLTGDSHGCKLLRSSGFNAIDEEAVNACRAVKEHLFPPEAAVEADALAHVPVQLVLERP